MQVMHEYNSPTPPIDLNGLHLLRLVARYRNITAAAEVAGMSQSALTRQVQAAEHKLGVKLFERTTRSLTITEAGAVLLRETEAIPNILDGALKRISEEYLGADRAIKIGISRSLSLSHIPGIFHAQQRLHPDIKIQVSQPTSSTLLKAVENSLLDLAILTRPKTLPSSVEVMHVIKDEFCLIASSQIEQSNALNTLAQWRKWAKSMSWILPPNNSQSRVMIEEWSAMYKIGIEAHTELDNYDVMAQLVALNMGVALVPRRSLTSFPRKKNIQRIKLPKRLERELVVIMPKRPNTPEHVLNFVKSILFS